MPRSTFGVASSSKVWAISSAVICRCNSAVDMWLLLEWTGRHSGARKAKPGMSVELLLHVLDAFPVGLAIAEGLERDVLQHGVAEFVLVDFGHGQALVLEEGDQLGFVLLDLLGCLGRRLLGHVGEDLLVLVAQLLPERTGNHRVE